jgi:dinuclear metal center YbgI/SA1388 family protein
MATTQDELSAYLAELLDTAAFSDYGYNGLQVSGPAEINSIASSETASLEICQRAVESKSDALIVHHGLIWGGVDRIDGLLRERLARLLAGNCKLLAYHLPLDAHPVWGNNHKALEMLEISDEGGFGDYKGQQIGRWGRLKTPLSPEELSVRCQSVFNHPVLHCPGSSSSIQSIGIVTGGGQGSLLSAQAAGLDALITGEASEQTWHEAAESGCHCFACGHYATECHAIHALATHLADKFNLRHTSLDQDNPI